MVQMFISSDKFIYVAQEFLIAVSLLETKHFHASDKNLASPANGATEKPMCKSKPDLVRCRWRLRCHK